MIIMYKMVKGCSNFEDKLKSSQGKLNRQLYRDKK